MPPKKQVREDDVWTDLTETVETIKGERISYPKKISLRKELQLRAIMRERLSSQADIFSQGDLPEGKAISFLLEIIPAVVAPIAAVMLEKDENWVLDNLEGEVAEVIASPFLTRFFKNPIPSVLLNLEELMPGSLISSPPALHSSDGQPNKPKTTA